MKKQYVATFDNGTTIARSYGEGYSRDEAWGAFCALVWDEAVKRGSKTVRMGDKFGVMLHRIAPQPPAGMTRWTMLGASDVTR